MIVLANLLLQLVVGNNTGGVLKEEPVLQHCFE